MNAELAHMCRIAKSRLDNKKILAFVYEDNKDAPQSLRDVISAFVRGEADQAETERKLDELPLNE